VAQGGGPEFKPQYWGKKKKSYRGIKDYDGGGEFMI
jgi:hypothetical protein